jgi:predicted HicB family RNase H-like nuclease
MMKYKGYCAGKITFDDNAGIFHGEVVGTRDVITFQGKSAAQLKKAFKDSVDEYLAFCNERGREPEKAFSGRFVLRIGPEEHRMVSAAAQSSGVSINTWIAHTIQQKAEEELGP